MKLVIIESPYAGEVEINMAYARACLFDSLRRGEAPIASHLLYPQVLDDNVTAERTQGMLAGLAWSRVAEAAAFYVDRGLSDGMLSAMARHKANGVRCYTRRLRGCWQDT